MLTGKRKPGRGGGGKDDWQSALSCFPCARQFQSDGALADTDRVKPNRFSSGQALAHPGIIKSDALTEVLAITTAAKHFHKVAGQKKNQSDGPGQIVDESDHERCG